uniref:Uncharacterized protein n=1 Tax=Mustela putorius furo TaxID=9669 RepID=M3YNB6_MUSPF
MAKRYTERYSTSLTIREMQIQITKKYQLSPVRMAFITKFCLRGSQWIWKSQQ